MVAGCLLTHLVVGSGKDGLNLAELNALPEEAFVAALGGVWEQSPWIAERAAGMRPFSTREVLLDAMWEVISKASFERQMELILAHPDLAGKLARAGRLTAESTTEQSSVGLDRLDDEAFEAFSSRNAAYRERFGFPFIICVRENTKDSILAAFDRRLENSVEAERENALEEIRKIAWLRICDLIEA